MRCSALHGPTVPFTVVFDGRSNATDPHFAGPVFVQCATPPSLMSVPGVAQKVAVYFPRGAKAIATHDVPAPHDDVTL